MNGNDLILTVQDTTLSASVLRQRRRQMMLYTSQRVVRFLDAATTESSERVFTTIQVNGQNYAISSDQARSALLNGTDQYLTAIGFDGAVSDTYVTVSADDIVEAISNESMASFNISALTNALNNVSAEADLSIVVDYLSQQLSYVGNEMTHTFQTIVAIIGSSVSKTSEFIDTLWSYIFPESLVEEPFRTTIIGEVTGTSGLELFVTEIAPEVSTWVSNVFTAVLALFNVAVKKIAENVYQAKRQDQSLIQQTWFAATGRLPVTLIGASDDDASFSNGYIDVGPITSSDLISKLENVTELVTNSALCIPSLGATFYVVKIAPLQYNLGLKKHIYLPGDAEVMYNRLAASGNSVSDVVELYKTGAGVLTKDTNIPDRYTYQNTPNAEAAVDTWWDQLNVCEKLIGMGIALIAPIDITNRYLQDETATTAAIYRDMGKGTVTNYDDLTDAKTKCVAVIEEAVSVANPARLLTYFQSSLNQYLASLENSPSSSPIHIIVQQDLGGMWRLRDDVTKLELTKLTLSVAGLAVTVAAATAAYVYAGVKIHRLAGSAYNEWQRGIFDNTLSEGEIRKLKRKYDFLARIAASFFAVPLITTVGEKVFSNASDASEQFTSIEGAVADSKDAADLALQDIAILIRGR